MNTTLSKCPRSRTAIMTVSGRYWDAMDPRPEWVWMPDVSHGLEIPRFNGQTSYLVTVASHLLRRHRKQRDHVLHGRHAAADAFGGALKALRLVHNV